MSEAVAVPQSASHAERGVADTEIAAGFISKQVFSRSQAGDCKHAECVESRAERATQ